MAISRHNNSLLATHFSPARQTPIIKIFNVKRIITLKPDFLNRAVVNTEKPLRQAKPFQAIALSTARARRLLTLLLIGKIKPNYILQVKKLKAVTAAN